MNAFLEPVILNTLIYSKMSPYRSKNHWKSPLASIMNRMRYSTLKASKQMDAQSSKYLKHSCPHTLLTPTNTHTHTTHNKNTHRYHPAHSTSTSLPTACLSLSLSLDTFHLCSGTFSKRASCPVPEMLSAVHLCL